MNKMILQHLELIWSSMVPSSKFLYERSVAALSSFDFQCLFFQTKQCLCALWPKRESTARNCCQMIVNIPLFKIYHWWRCLILIGWKIKVISATTETFNFDDISSSAVLKVWNNPALITGNWCSLSSNVMNIKW